jgi:hypothetical protein
VSILAPSGVPARLEIRRNTIRARYDAAFSGGPERTSAPQYQHPYRDITPSVRIRLMDGSCDLADNSPFFSGLFERLVTYVIGTGIWPQSDSGDSEWDKLVDDQFQSDVEDCEVRGGVSWATLQQQAYRTEIKQGDCGEILTNDEQGNPKVLAVEGRDIGDRWGVTTSKDLFDGVRIGPRGERLGYVLTSEDPLGTSITIPVSADWFVHHFNPLRPGQLRGIPLLASALNTGRDVHDILNLEKLAVKDASSKTDIIKTESGQFDPEEAYNAGGATSDGSDGEDRANYYRKIFGPEARYIKREDSWEAYKSDRPGPAWQGFMDFLSQTICLAARIPPSVLLQIKVGGADTRRDLAAAARVFEAEQHRLAGQWARVRNFFVLRRIEDGTLKGAPPTWRRVSWQFPKAITVDAGREAQQDREDVRGGFMSEQEYQGRWGANWRKHRDQVELETRDRIQRAKAVSEAENVPFDVALRMLGTPQDQQPPAQLPPQQQAPAQ